MTVIDKVNDIADAVVCGCTTDEIIADVDVLRSMLERQAD